MCASDSAPDPIRRLALEPGCVRLRTAGIGSFLAECPHALIFLAGDDRHRAESSAVAAILGGLLQRHPVGLRVGLVGRLDDADTLQSLGAVALPSVVFVRHGHLLEVIAGSRDPALYAAACERLFEDARA
jgi:hypothetical protein